jgi:hypothetical protein
MNNENNREPNQDSDSALQSLRHKVECELLALLAHPAVPVEFKAMFKDGE